MQLKNPTYEPIISNLSICGKSCGKQRKKLKTFFGLTDKRLFLIKYVNNNLNKEKN